MWLSFDINDDSIKIIHCWKCSKILFKTVKGVRLLVPSYSISASENKRQNDIVEASIIDKKEDPIILRCKQCKHQFNIR